MGCNKVPTHPTFLVFFTHIKNYKEIILKNCQIFFWLILGIITYLSAGCAPIYDTEYAMTAPTTSKGKDCIAQCEISKRQCFDWEKKKKAYCELKVELSCDDEEQTMTYQPKAINRRCESYYRHCYQTCGGTVTSQKVCVFGCS